MKLPIFRKPRKMSRFEKDLVKAAYPSNMTGYANYVLGKANLDNAPIWAVDSGLKWDKKKKRYVTTQRLSKDLLGS